MTRVGAMVTGATGMHERQRRVPGLTDTGRMPLPLPGPRPVSVLLSYRRFAPSFVPFTLCILAQYRIAALALAAFLKIAG